MSGKRSLKRTRCFGRGLALQVLYSTEFSNARNQDELRLMFEDATAIASPMKILSSATPEDENPAEVLQKPQNALQSLEFHGDELTAGVEELDAAKAFQNSEDLKDLKDSADSFESFDSDGEGFSPPAQSFAWELVCGVWAKVGELDKQIQAFAKNWRVDRLGRIELTLLRLAAYEMIYRDDIPINVSINEALDLNRAFGDEQARRFINGILDSLARSLRQSK